MIIQDKRDVLERKGAWILAEAIQQAAEEKSRVTVAVPGGRSVVKLLENLQYETVDWEKVHLFMVDERIVPPDHEDSNFRQVASCLEDVARSACLYPLPYGSEGATAGVARYRERLSALGGRYDVVLLASGEDGHVAGLFPEHETVRSEDPFFVVTESSPKPPPFRMSSSRKLIGSSRTAVLLFFGSEKHQAFAAYRDENVSVYQCPAKIVNSVPDRYVLTDFGYC